MPLTDAQVRNLTASGKAYRIWDHRALYIEVTPSGSKLWRYKYRYGGKEKRLALGKYPQVKLGGARRKRDAARLQLDGGLDPSLERKREKASRRVAAANTFSAVAEEYIQKAEQEGRAKNTIDKARWYVSLLAGTIGSLPLDDISPQLLLMAVKQHERRGVHETAKKALNLASRIFCYGVRTARATSDPAALLKGALITRKVKHHAAVLDKGRLGELLRAIDHYERPITRLALKSLAHVFLRPGELRHATWDDIDFEKKVWTIPAERTKMRRAHFVPLSAAVIELLHETQQLTGPSGYVFPALNKRRAPMSENTLNMALRRMGFSKGEATSHGFRATASTLLNECSPFSADAIERALAHAPKNAVRAAYNRGDHWDERVEMAEWWSDFLQAVEASTTRARAA